MSIPLRTTAVSSSQRSHDTSTSRRGSTSSRAELMIPGVGVSTLKTLTSSQASFDNLNSVLLDKKITDISSSGNPDANNHTRIRSSLAGNEGLHLRKSSSRGSQEIIVTPDQKYVKITAALLEAFFELQTFLTDDNVLTHLEKSGIEWDEEALVKEPTLIVSYFKEIIWLLMKLKRSAESNKRDAAVKEYEKSLQKLENETRQHIRIQQQMKLVVETLQGKIEEKDTHLVRSKKIIDDVNFENEKLKEKVTKLMKENDSLKQLSARKKSQPTYLNSSRRTPPRTSSAFDQDSPVESPDIGARNLQSRRESTLALQSGRNLPTEEADSRAPSARGQSSHGLLSKSPVPKTKSFLPEDKNEIKINKSTIIPAATGRPQQEGSRPNLLTYLKSKMQDRCDSLTRKSPGDGALRASEKSGKGSARDTLDDKSRRESLPGNSSKNYQQIHGKSTLPKSASYLSGGSNKK